MTTTKIDYTLPPLDFELSGWSLSPIDTLTQGTLDSFDNKTVFKQDDIIAGKVISDPTILITEDNNNINEKAVNERYNSSFSTNSSSTNISSTHDFSMNNIYIKQHDNPSTSAAAIAAAEIVIEKHNSNISKGQVAYSFLNTSPSHSTTTVKEMPKKSILKKSSMFFTQKILKKKPSSTPGAVKLTRKEQERHINSRRTSGFVIKPNASTKSTCNQKASISSRWWKGLKIFSQ